MTKYLLLALGIVSLAASGLLWALLKVAEGKAVAEAANAALEAQVKAQQSALEDARQLFQDELGVWQEIARQEGERRQALSDELVQAERDIEAAIAGMTDEERQCAVERVPDGYVDSLLNFDTI